MYTDYKERVERDGLEFMKPYLEVHNMRIVPLGDDQALITDGDLMPIEALTTSFRVDTKTKKWLNYITGAKGKGFTGLLSQVLGRPEEQCFWYLIGCNKRLGIIPDWQSA